VLYILAEGIGGRPGASTRGASITSSIAAHLNRAPAHVLRALPASFAGDPADRLIYATAVEHGWPLVTKDRRLRNHRHPRPVTVW
jgi:PIN domain nuclease of toxin-antitoxin system